MSTVTNQLIVIIRKAIDIFASRGLKCCLVGSVASYEYGVPRTPNVSIFYSNSLAIPLVITIAYIGYRFGRPHQSLRAGDAEVDAGRRRFQFLSRAISQPSCDIQGAVVQKRGHILFVLEGRHPLTWDHEHSECPARSHRVKVASPYSPDASHASPPAKATGVV